MLSGCGPKSDIWKVVECEELQETMGRNRDESQREQEIIVEQEEDGISEIQSLDYRDKRRMSFGRTLLGNEDRNAQSS